MTELPDQALIGLRLFDRIEILALDILDQRNFQRLRLVEITDDRGDAVELRPLRRSPAPLARDDLIAINAGRANNDRLNDAARADAVGQLLQRTLVKVASRLVRMRRYRSNINELDVSTATLLALRSRLLLRDGDIPLRLREERRQSAAEALWASWAPGGTLLRAHATSSLMTCGSRPISSRASCI